jgi:hypothetical protein
MEQSKYFTPNIEDIRVGYECEMSTDRFEFFKTKIDLSDINDLIDWYRQGYFTNNLSDIIKVPYLTKEQIEAEGWKTWNGAGDFQRTKPLFFISKKLDIPAGNRNYSLVNCGYNFETKELKIDIEQLTIFIGECKDINTFRYICKLLNIK